MNINSNIPHRGFKACKGIEPDYFYTVWQSMPKRMQKKFAIVIARIAEKSFRRGVQQTAFLIKHGVLDPNDEGFFYEFRYRPSLDNTPKLDDYPKIKSNNLGGSLERLDMEHGIELNAVGISIPIICSDRSKCEHKEITRGD